MKKFVTIAALLLLAACEQAPAAYTPEAFTYNAPPIRVDVAQIKVVDNYHSPMRAPNVEFDFPTPPDTAVKEWANQRLEAAGHAGMLEVDIDDASVKAVKLPKTKGLKGLFTDDQDTRYDARLHVTFRLYNGTDAMSVASGDVVITRSHTINEKATVDDRLHLFDSMTHEMMASFDQLAEQRLRQYFANYLR